MRKLFLQIWTKVLCALKDEQELPECMLDWIRGLFDLNDEKISNEIKHSLHHRYYSFSICMSWSRKLILWCHIWLKRISLYLKLIYLPNATLIYFKWKWHTFKLLKLFGILKTLCIFTKWFRVLQKFLS